MTNRRILVTCTAIAFTLVGCGANGNSPQIPSQSNLRSNTLQFAVGTANLYGLATGLNVVTTYRQPNGKSGTLLNSPILTVPARSISAAASTNVAGYDVVSTVLMGPTSAEIASGAIGSTSQTAGINCATSASSFG
jgi:hypothetical protein